MYDLQYLCYLDSLVGCPVDFRDNETMMGVQKYVILRL